MDLVLLLWIEICHDFFITSTFLLTFHLYWPDIIWIVIQVEEGGIMGVTQAMKHLTHVMADAQHSNSLAHHSPSPYLAWSCSPSSDSKLNEEEMSPDDVSPSGVGGGNVLHNPFHLVASPRRSDEFDASSPSRFLAPGSCGCMSVVVQ